MTQQLAAVNSVDLFAGGGGASLAIQQSTGRSPLVAVNHCAHAIEMHTLNHPETIHLHTSVHDVDPRRVAAGIPIDLLWLSPDCTHFSRAKGGKPRSKGIRDLAWVAVDWAREVAPGCIILENVPEFVTWGPLDDEGQPIKPRAGETFRAFVQALEQCGYQVDWRVLSSADYGTPTSRRRLYLIARRGFRPIRWPEPTHGPGRALPWRTAAECIDWSIPVPSIFERKKPLAEATQRRIAEGIRRYVLQAARPFIVTTGHQSSDGGKVRSADEPLSTVVTKAEHCVIIPSMVQVGWGEREGQAPRVLDIKAPLGSVVAGGQKHGLVAAFLAKHYGGPNGHPCYGQSLDQPAGSVTGRDSQGVVTAFLDKFHGSARAGVPLDAPLPTVTAGGGRGGGHAGLVAAFLARYYGQGGQWSGCDQPLPTVVSKDRFALVTVELDGEPWVLTDIGMRMLQPRELARASGVDDSYQLIGTKSQQVARIGNMVNPPIARALIEAQLDDRGELRGAA